MTDSIFSRYVKNRFLQIVKFLFDKGAQKQTFLNHEKAHCRPNKTSSGNIYKNDAELILIKEQGNCSLQKMVEIVIVDVFSALFYKKTVSNEQ